MEEPHQNMLRELVDTVVGQINALNTELIAVKLKMQYVVKFRDKNSFICLNSSDVHEFHTYLAPLVYMDKPLNMPIFTGELGTAEDYQREFKDTLLVSLSAKLRRWTIQLLARHSLSSSTTSLGTRHGLYSLKRLLITSCKTGTLTARRIL